MSSCTSGSRFSRLIVGGTSGRAAPGRRPIDSTAPAAPSRCPVIDLVDVTATCGGGVAECGPDGQRLGDVALRSAGAVGVDVHDVGRVGASVSQRHPHRASGALTLRVGLGDVVAVGGDPGSGHLGVDRGATGLGVLGGLEDEHGCALAEHEAVASGVPGT